MTYAEKLKDPRWQKMRLKILERDEWKCKICNDTEETLHVHHRYYLNDIENPWEYSEYALATLCATCHEKEQADAPKAKKLFMEALVRRSFLFTEDFAVLTQSLNNMDVYEGEKKQDFIGALIYVMKNQNFRKNLQKKQNRKKNAK